MRFFSRRHDQQGDDAGNAGPKVLLFAATSRPVLFELLLHGGNAAMLVGWWQRFPTKSFRRRMAGGSTLQRTIALLRQRAPNGPSIEARKNEGRITIKASNVGPHVNLGILYSTGPLNLTITLLKKFFFSLHFPAFFQQ
jgi:hypothetical protein